MVVLDSSLLVGFFNIGDVHHASAVETMRRIDLGEWGAPRLPEYVFLETVTVLAARAGQAIATSASRELATNSAFHLTPGYHLFGQARKLFEGQKRRRWSFTDAAIIALARNRKDEFVASFDLDFDGVQGIKRVP